jgi:hypothetical protein
LALPTVIPWGQTHGQIFTQYSGISSHSMGARISNDRNLMEAVLEQLKMLWGKPWYYVFVCAGDFAQVSKC